MVLQFETKEVHNLVTALLLMPQFAIGQKISLCINLGLPHQWTLAVTGIFLISLSGALLFTWCIGYVMEYLLLVIEAAPYVSNSKMMIGLIFTGLTAALFKLVIGYMDDILFFFLVIEWPSTLGLVTYYLRMGMTLVPFI